MCRYLAVRSAVRSGEHIGILTLTNKWVQPRKDSHACHYFLNCNNSPTFEDFSLVCHENKVPFRTFIPSYNER